MAIVSLSALKERFQNGDFPTGSDFENLIDSCYNDYSSLSTYNFVVSTVNTFGKILSANVDLLDIFLTSETDSQNLFYDPASYTLSITNGNTVNLSSINSTFANNSGKYESAYLTFQEVSSTYATITILNSVSSQLTTNIDFNNYQTSIAETTATLLPTSIFQNASGDWQYTFNKVNSSSNYWDTVYTTVQEASSNWFSASGAALESANSYAHANFLPLTGGTLDGEILGDLFIVGSLSASGTATFNSLSISGTISQTGVLSSVAANFQGSVVEGIGGEAIGIYSHTEGAYNKATGLYAHAEGGSITDPNARNTASGTSSHAEGRGTFADGLASHAEGILTQALGLGAHAEGLSSFAIGDYSHAAGQSTFASGTRAYTTGQATSATKTTSYAHGRFSLANHSRSWIWQGTGTEGLIFTTTKTDQFAIRPEGGFYLSGNMGINTDSIDYALTVVGDISASGKIISSNVISSDPTLVPSTPAANTITNIVTLSQTAYNSIVTKDPNTLYIIV